MTLDELFLKHGTDKGSTGHNYSPYYEMMLAPYRDMPISLLEIGVWEGASCRAWKDYFPKANIFGVDLDYKPQYNSERIFMIQADQSKKEDLWRLAMTPHDIIIDDGSHRSIDQISSFTELFPSLKPGGLYIIEDLLCAYDERWNKEANVMDEIRLLVGDVQMNGAVPGSRLCANKPEQVRLYGGKDYFQDNIEWIFLAMGVIFIKKMA
jgi:hypothetical protein